jgi:hypothetical protein
LRFLSGASLSGGCQRGNTHAPSGSASNELRLKVAESLVFEKIAKNKVKKTRSIVSYFKTHRVAPQGAA